jgi:hypothetical protein
MTIKLTISRTSKTPDDKIFIHYKIETIPPIPVSVNCHLGQSLQSLPDNTTVSEIWRRLALNNETHSQLLVRLSSFFQQ